MSRKPNDEAGRLTGTQSIERALLLLREIAAHNRTGSRLLDLATRTSLQRPTVHRMLKCLAHEGMVQQDPDTHRYYLGSMAFELGLTAARMEELRRMLVELIMGTIQYRHRADRKLAQFGIK